jgi:hypothetical protein
LQENENVPTTDSETGALSNLANDSILADAGLDQKYNQLRNVYDELLESERFCDDAQHDRDGKENAFAKLCAELWRGSKESKPMGKKGKGVGFDAKMREMEISPARAYRAVRSHYPEDYAALKVKRKLPDPPEGSSSHPTKAQPPFQFVYPYPADDLAALNQAVAAMGVEVAAQLILDAILEYHQELKAATPAPDAV